MPELQRQPGAASAIRAGVQPGQLPASAGAAERVVRGDFRADPLVRRLAAVGAEWLTQQLNESLAFGVAELDAARKRVGLAVPEATGAGLARRNGETGTDHGEKGCSPLN